MRTSRIICGTASAVLAIGVMDLGAGGVGATGAPATAEHSDRHGLGR